MAPYILGFVIQDLAGEKRIGCGSDFWHYVYNDVDLLNLHGIAMRRAIKLNALGKGVVQVRVWRSLTRLPTDETSFFISWPVKTHTIQGELT